MSLVQKVLHPCCLDGLEQASLKSSIILQNWPSEILVSTPEISLA